MKLNTERLRIIPLTLGQFSKLLNEFEKMETELNLVHSNEKLDENTQIAMNELYKLAINNKKDYLWYTNWQIILKTENRSIGSACFMRAPNDNGIVEIGYGINKNYQNKGYMTEALSAMCEWALKQKNVKCVIAETEKYNLPSHKVLQKCGMIKYKQDESSLWWKLEINDKGNILNMIN